MMPMNPKTPQERYLNDPIFKVLVDFVRRGIREAQYTPTEVREAAVLAVYLEEIEKPSARVIAMRELEDWVETGRAVKPR